MEHSQQTSSKITHALEFEAFSQKHIATYYSWRTNPQIAQYDQPGFVRPMNFEAVETWCQKIIASDQGYTFFVKDKETDSYIGICALMNADMINRNAECSIVIGEPAYWGKGYGTVIMKQLISWAFNDLGLHKVYLHVFSFNTRAIALYEKLGFQLEGRHAQEVFINGAFTDILRYGLFRRNTPYGE